MDFSDIDELDEESLKELYDDTVINDLHNENITDSVCHRIYRGLYWTPFTEHGGGGSVWYNWDSRFRSYCYTTCSRIRACYKLNKVITFEDSHTQRYHARGRNGDWWSFYEKHGCECSRR